MSGTVYTARDAAHKRMYEAMQRGEEIPIDLNNNIVYYLGPSPAREGQVIGSAGPTTSSRMDKYTPLFLYIWIIMLQLPLLQQNKQHCLCALTLSLLLIVFLCRSFLLIHFPIKAEVIAYDDLGTEAIRKLEVENLPVIVVIDHEKKNMYEEAIK